MVMDEESMVMGGKPMVMDEKLVETKIIDLKLILIVSLCMSLC